jgi:hypothetical protein
MEKTAKFQDTHYRYYNIKIANLTNNTLKQASYNETRTSDIIEDKLSNWEVAVARFRIPSHEIPIFVFIDATYFLTLTDTAGADHTQALVYVPITNIPNTEQFITSYNQWVDIVNNAFLAAWLAIPVLIRPTVPPFILYDPITQLFSVYATSDYNSFFGQANKTQIWFNARLSEKFDTSTLQGFYQTLTNIKSFNVYIKTNGSNQIIAGPTTFLNTTPASAGVTYLQMTQEFKALFVMSDFDTLLLKCSKLPVVAEYNSSIDGNADQFINMMTDFEPTFDNNFNNHSDFQYNPNVYRWTSLFSNSKLREMDLSIFWRTVDGTIRPLLIGPQQEVSLKLVFRKKFHIDTL